MRLLDVLSAHAGDVSLGDDALEELRVELQAAAVWVHVVDLAGTLNLAGERGLPAEIASCWRTLSTDAPELAARVFRSGQPAELRAASTGQAPSTERSLLQLQATDARLRALPLCAQHWTLGVLSYASTEVTVAGEREKDIVALLSLALGQSVLLPVMARAASEKDRLSQIIESLPYGLIFVDAATGHLVVSRGMSELFGRKFEPDGGVTQKLGILCWPDGRLLTEDELPSMRVLRGELLVEQEFVVARGDGRRIPVIERSTPVHDHEGNVVGAVIIYRDVSAQKEVDRLREEFAAMVAHDLRNPLQSMLLQINMLRKTVEEGQTPALNAFDRLMRSGARLSQMASDLLDSTRLELSRAHLDTVPLDLPQAVESIVERVRPTLGERSLTFEVHGRPPVALLDPTRLDQILTNLLENAAKYSAEGTIIRVWVAEAEGGVEIYVKDEGFGIGPDEIPKLFDRFYQTKRARERKTGLGLGLYIAKGFVDAHGGRIDVQSAPDRGSTFRVWFPAAPPIDDAETDAA